MTYFYTGQNYRIVERLRRDNREYQEGIAIQLHTNASWNGTEGWAPYSVEELFPVCPVVGDTFMLKGYYSTGHEESVGETEFKWWRVIARSLHLSGPSATKMHGIVDLLVEEVDGPFSQLTEGK
jgi:hypothetical protein